MYQALIFDLDGTLLDTITDITIAINEALQKCGYSYSYDRESTKTLIGDGADILVHRALREKDGDVDAFNALKAAYMPLYKAYQNDHTKAFEGMVETVKKLKERGVDLFIVSNKPDQLVLEVIPKHFPNGTFLEFHGNKEGDAVKPDPHLVNDILRKYGYDKDKVLYVGDSKPDVLTARNAGIDCAICTWGYGNYEDPILRSAKYHLNEAKELLSLPVK